MKIHLSNFAPIIFIEAYLILTLIIFAAGPINYYIELDFSDNQELSCVI